MKIEKAIEFIKIRRQWLSDDEDTANIEGRNKAAQICRNQMQWFDLAISALEKQILKTAPNVRENGLANILFGDCPICKSAVYTDEKYCGQCGQALKWSGKDED